MKKAIWTLILCIAPATADVIPMPPDAGLGYAILFGLGYVKWLWPLLAALYCVPVSCVLASRLYAGKGAPAGRFERSAELAAYILTQIFALAAAFVCCLAVSAVPLAAFAATSAVSVVMRRKKKKAASYAVLLTLIIPGIGVMITAG